MRTAPVTALAVFVLALPAARADLPPPPPPPKEVKFTLEVDEKAKAPRLIVPQPMAGVQFRPRGPIPKATEGKEPVAFLEIDGDEPAPRNPNHLMIAGVALSLTLGLGGIWLVRRPGRGAGRGLVLLLVAGGTLAAGTAVWANVAPAPPPPAEKKAIVTLPVAFDGNVSFEMSRGGDTIRLVLDKDTYEKMKKEPKAPEAK
jgi:hypothetical protein